MQKLNVFFLVLILLIGTFIVLINKEKRNNRQTSLKESLESKHSKSNATPKKPNKQTEAKTENLDNLSFFFQQDPSLSSEESSNKKEMREEVVSHKKNDQKIFKTADEILSTLFPNLEKQIGKKHRDDFRHGIPLTHMLQFIIPLTEEQKQKYKELKELKSAEIEATSPHEGPFTLEESFEITRQVRLISEHFGIESINLLTEEQLIQYKELAQKSLDKYEKFLKKDGKIFYVDTFEERQRLYDEAKMKKQKAKD